MAEGGIDPDAFFTLGYGLYVVSSGAGGRANGQISNSVMQVSSDPPRVCTAVNKKAFTHEIISRSRAFAVTVLSEKTPMEFIRLLGFSSGRDTDKLAGVDYKIGQTGAPVLLEHAAAYFEAEVIQETDVGTHTVFIGKIVAAEVLSDEKCLSYEHYHEIKRGTTPKTAPTHIAESKGG